jgi:hypothetical protein
MIAVSILVHVCKILMKALVPGRRLVAVTCDFMSLFHLKTTDSCNSISWSAFFYNQGVDSTFLRHRRRRPVPVARYKPGQRGKRKNRFPAGKRKGKLPEVANIRMMLASQGGEKRQNKKLTFFLSFFKVSRSGCK